MTRVEVTGWGTNCCVEAWRPAKRWCDDRGPSRGVGSWLAWRTLCLISQQLSLLLLSAAHPGLLGDRMHDEGRGDWILGLVDVDPDGGRSRPHQSLSISWLVSRRRNWRWGRPWLSLGRRIGGERAPGSKSPDSCLLALPPDPYLLAPVSWLLSPDDWLLSPGSDSTLVSGLLTVS